MTKRLHNVFVYKIFIINEEIQNGASYSNAQPLSVNGPTAHDAAILNLCNNKYRTHSLTKLMNGFFEKLKNVKG